MDKKKSIFILLLIVATVLGIYFYKNGKSEKAREPRESARNVQTENVAQEMEQELEDTLAVKVADLEKLKSSGLPTMIDFGAESCGPCKKMAPILEKLYEEWKGKAVIQFMDVWTYQEGISDFPLQVIPTQFFFDDDGSPFIPSEKLQEEMDFIMYQTKETGEHVFTAHQGTVTEEQVRKIFEEMGIE